MKTKTILIEPLVFVLCLGFWSCNAGMFPDQDQGSMTPVDEQVVVFFDDFESDLGWVVDPAYRGQWERANPQETAYRNTIYQLDQAASEFHALVTGPSAGFLLEVMILTMA